MLYMISSFDKREVEVGAGGKGIYDEGMGSVIEG